MLEAWILNPNLRDYVLRAEAERNKAIRALLRGIPGLVRGIFGRTARAVARWHGKRQMIRELSGLDDRALKDIGLYRNDILSLAEARWSGGTQPEAEAGRPRPQLVPLDPRKPASTDLKAAA